THMNDRLAGMSLEELRRLRAHSSSRARRRRLPVLLPQRRESILPLSYAQERLWFLDQLGLVGAAYNMPFVLRLRGALDVTALEHALSDLMRRHESLRTRFESIDGRPIQVIDRAKPVTLTPLDLSSLADQEREQQVRRLSSIEAQRPFDLARGPL